MSGFEKMLNSKELVGQSVSQTELARKEKEEERYEKKMQFGEMLSIMSDMGVAGHGDAIDQEFPKFTEKMKELIDSEDPERTAELTKEFCESAKTLAMVQVSRGDRTKSEMIVKNLEEIALFGLYKKMEEEVTNKARLSLYEIIEWCSDDEGAKKTRDLASEALINIDTEKLKEAAEK